MKRSALLLALLSIFIGCQGISLEVKIPKSVIVSQLETRFPFTKNKGLLSVTVSDPVLNFNGTSNRLEVSATTVIRLLGLVPLKGAVAADGAIDYRSATATFHLKELKIKELKINGLPENQMETASGLLGSALLSVLGDIEIYKLNPGELKENLGKLLLKGVRMADDGIFVRLGVGG